jgi:hypothetical protein
MCVPEFSHYAECHYAKHNIFEEDDTQLHHTRCHYAKRRKASCHYVNIIILVFTMLSLCKLCSCRYVSCHNA